MKVNVGCCGWSFFLTKDYFNDWKSKFKSVLQAYTARFNYVEVNSTFYRIPKVSTAEKWLLEAMDINRDFEFIVKASQIITHIERFSSKSVRVFDQMKEICKALDSNILLLQSPASFSPDKKNIEKIENFFKKIDREKLILAWEPRGKWWNQPELIENICKRHNLVNCVDPFRNNVQYFGKSKIAYFRIHGLGKPMYNYVFSKEELNKLKGICDSISKNVKKIYVMFNNIEMYRNAEEFSQYFLK